MLRGSWQKHWGNTARRPRASFILCSSARWLAGSLDATVQLGPPKMRRKRNVTLQSHHWLAWLWTLVTLFEFIALLAPSVSADITDNCTNPEPRTGWTCVINSKSINTVVSIWCPWNNDIVYVNAFINATRNVASINPDTRFIITIKSWVGSPEGDSYNEELRKAAEEKRLPTLFPVSPSWMGYLANQSAVYNMTDFVNQWMIANNGVQQVQMFLSVLDLWADQGTWWSVPITTDTILLAYNKRAFDSVKVPYPPANVTWDEIYDLAAKVNNSLGGKYGFGLYEGWEGTTKLLLPLLQPHNDTSDVLSTGSNDCALLQSVNLQAIANLTNMWTSSGGPVAAPLPECGDRAPGQLLPTLLTDALGGVAMMILPPSVLATLNMDDVGVSALPRAFLGGAGLSIAAAASLGPRAAAWQIIVELVNPSKYNLDYIALKTFAPPPITRSLSLLSEPPWNVSGSPYNAAKQALVSATGNSFLSKRDPYTYIFENRHIFRCMLKNITMSEVTVPVGVRDLCKAMNSIKEEFCSIGGTCKKHTSQIGLIVGVVIAGIALILSIVVVSMLSYVWGRFNTLSVRIERRISQRVRDPNNSARGLRRFTKKELRFATDNFDKDNLVGKGGFGLVYRGVLMDKSVVAIKQLTEHSYQGEEEFLNEIEIIGTVHHRNLVSLQGYCLVDNQMMLVYDFMENGSLEDAIFGRRRRKLTWPQCFEILNCTATGLSYLHDACQYKIIHRDIKPANILLDSSLKARVADFGMAKNTSLEHSHVSTRVMGTTGYLDPNYGYTGQLTEKSDVYSFGVVILVVLLGRRPVEVENVNISGHKHEVALLDWLQYVGEFAIEDVRLRFGDTFVEAEARRCILVAILCIQKFADARPTMSQVVQMLVGLHHIPRLPPRDPIKDVFIPDYSNSGGTTTISSSSHRDSESGNSGPMFSISNKEISLIQEGR